jgi:hypothetical protein
MIIYEQADASAKSLCGATYCWILVRPDRAAKKSLTTLGWKAVRPFKALLTHDPELAAETAALLGCDIVTDGTHAVVKCPGLLCIV